MSTPERPAAIRRAPAEIGILGSPGVDIEPVVTVLRSSLGSDDAQLRILLDPRDSLNLGSSAILVAVLSGRLGEIFEDLIGLRLLGLPWIAIAPSEAFSAIRSASGLAGAEAVIDEAIMQDELPRLIVELSSAGPTARGPYLHGGFVGMLTHVLGMSAALEFTTSDRRTIEIAIENGSPWSCRSSAGNRGAAAALEALGWETPSVRVVQGDPGPRNLFVSWPELLERNAANSSPERNGDFTMIPQVLRKAPGSPPDGTQHQMSRMRKNMANNLDLSSLVEIEGFIGACLVDSESGMVLGQEGGSGVLNLEVAAAGNTEVVRAKRKTMRSLALKDDIEDILITLNKQYHLIRPLKKRDTLFLYIAVNRSQANLAMTRIRLREFEEALKL